MCGLFGFIGQSADYNKLSMLAIANDDRGGHATGVFADGKTYKRTQPAKKFIPSIKAKIKGVQIAMGHTRYATHGENNTENAHPFSELDIVGAHNGIISNYRQLAKDYGFAVPQVDSQSIFRTLAPNDVTQWPELIANMQGSMAITVVKDERLFLYRRDNPLYIAQSKEGLYYSSVKQSLNMCGLIAEEIDCHKLISIGIDGKSTSLDVEPTTYSGLNWDNWDTYDVDNINENAMEVYDFLLDSNRPDLLLKYENLLREFGLL